MKHQIFRDLPVIESIHITYLLPTFIYTKNTTVNQENFGIEKFCQLNFFDAQYFRNWHSRWMK